MPPEGKSHSAAEDSIEDACVIIHVLHRQRSSSGCQSFVQALAASANETEGGAEEENEDYEGGDDGDGGGNEQEDDEEQLSSVESALYVILPDQYSVYDETLQHARSSPAPRVGPCN